MKKIMLLLLCMVLLVGVISADELLTIDNIKQYNESTQTITIVNTFGLGRDIATIQLNTPTNYKVGAGYQKVAEFTIDSFDDTYSDAFDKMNFYNAIDMEKIDRQFDYKYLTTEMFDVNDYKESCSTSENGTKECTYEIVGTHQEERKVWKDLDTSVLTKGKITIGIFTDVKVGDYVEWIPTLFGKEISEFASWTEDLNTNLIAYYKFDEGTGTNALDSIDGIYNLTGISTPKWTTSGLINDATNLTRTDSEYWNGTDDGLLFNYTTPFSINTWGLLYNLTVDGFLVSKAADDAINYGRYHLKFNQADNTMSYAAHESDNTQITITSNVTLTTGQWYMFTAVYNGSGGMSLFVNGSLAGKATITDFKDTGESPFKIGEQSGSTGSGTFFWDGLVDETGVWGGTALTQSQITQLYNNNLGIPHTDVFAANITLNTPIDNVDLTISSITFGGVVISEQEYAITNVSLIINDAYNETNTSGINNSNYTFIKTLEDGDYIWTYEACDNASQCTNGTARSFSIDTTNPAVIMLAPPTIVNYHRINTNLSINWSANDTNIDTCILQFEGVNRTVTCSDNSTQVNITNIINRTLIFYVNDTFGHMNSTSRSWNYTIFENNRIFNNETIEGTTENFLINYSIAEGFQTSLVNLIYNGTPYSTTLRDSNGIVIGENNLVIPDLSANSNVSFYWNITLTSGVVVSTSTSNQSVSFLSIDDCSTNTNLIYNYTLYDEETQDKLENNSIEIQIKVFDILRSISFLNFSKEYNETEDYAEVCLNIALLNTTSYSLDSTVKYNSNDSGSSYATEYYNILNFTLGNSTVPKLISLYDLLSADSTDFQLTFRDSNLAFFPDILVHVDRQYVSDGDFKTVEIPITDSNGQTILHLVRNDVIYNFIMVNSEGKVVATFNKFIAFCQDFTIGSCSIRLDEPSVEQQLYDTLEDVQISYAISYSDLTNVLSLQFLSNDLTTKTVAFEVIRNSDFGNRTACLETLTASSGTIGCDLSSISSSDRFLFANIYVESSIKATETIDLEADTKSFGDAGYFIAFLFFLFLLTMFIDDKQAVIISLGLGWVVVVSLGLLKGSLFGSISAGIWLVVCIIIFLWKLKKEKI